MHTLPICFSRDDDDDDDEETKRHNNFGAIPIETLQGKQKSDKVNINTGKEQVLS